MKIGDLVRLIPEDCGDNYDGLVGLIVGEADQGVFDLSSSSGRLFELVVDGRPGWRLYENSLEIIEGNT